MTENMEEQHRAEAERRWGGTEAYRESAKRTQGYSDAQWAEIKADMERIEADFAIALADGVAPDTQRAMDLAEQARLHIDERFYPCSHAMHAALADMYTADERFRAHYDDRLEGLADFVAAAVKANAGRWEEGPK